jgi:predicted RNase H-like HicB family nuclease
MTNQREDATYDAYLLHYRDGTWLAQLADLPGAYALGDSQEQATARLTAAIPAYYAWLSQHDDYTPTTHSVPHVTVREVAEASAGSGYGQGAFLSGDAAPVTEEDLDWWLAALGWAYDDLVEQAQRMPYESKYALLGAVARMQMDIVGQTAGGVVGQIVAPGTPPDPLTTLQLGCQTALAVFRRTNAEQRAAVREMDGQRWSVRRGLRESVLLVRRATEMLAPQGK